jgi:hypothetical protein
MGTKDNDREKRLGVTFHRSFALNRSAIRQVLKIAFEANQGGKSKVSQNDVRENSELGSIYIEAIPRWAWGAGLLAQNKSILPFGKYAYLYDPLLEQTGTQWLIHYHLSASHGPGPAFWNEIISNMFYKGNIFSSEDLVERIGNFIWKTENKIQAKRGVQSTATVFLGTYIKPDGLSKLHFLEETNSGRYRVCDPTKAPIWAIGCAFLDFWEANYPGRIGVGLDTLQESGLLQLFSLGKSEFIQILQSLQEVGYVEIHRSVPPHQVILLRQDQEGLLQKLYGAI